MERYEAFLGNRMARLRAHSVTGEQAASTPTAHFVGLEQAALEVCSALATAEGAVEALKAIRDAEWPMDEHGILLMPDYEGMAREALGRLGGR